MCSCRKSAGTVERAMVPPPPRRPAIIRGRAVPTPVSRPVIQKREITLVRHIKSRQRDPVNPRRNITVTTPKYIYQQKPLLTVESAKWGPQLWRTLHILSLRTASATAAWAALPNELDGALPCPECAQHYHEWYRAHPLTDTSPNGIRDWVLALHNQVNERRQVAPWTADQIVATYGSMTVADAHAALTEISEMIGIRGRDALRALIAIENNHQPL
jgi:hypothetical protein